VGGRAVALLVVVASGCGRLGYSMDPSILVDGVPAALDGAADSASAGGDGPTADAAPGDAPATDAPAADASPPDAPPPDAPPPDAPPPDAPLVVDAPAADAPPAPTQVRSFGERPSSTVMGVASDTFVTSLLPATNYGTERTIDIESVGEDQVGLLRFDLSSLPTTAAVMVGELRLATSNGAGTNSADPTRIYQVLEAWDALGATYDLRSSGTPWTSPGVGPGSRDTVILASFTPAAVATEYVIALPAAVVQGWVTSPATNFGLALVDAGADDAAFCSSEHNTNAMRPELVVTYVP
jgi:hypothetical protein